MEKKRTLIYRRNHENYLLIQAKAFLRPVKGMLDQELNTFWAQFSKKEKAKLDFGSMDQLSKAQWIIRNMGGIGGASFLYNSIHG